MILSNNVSPDFPVQDRTNLVVYTDSLVSKILWADNQDGLAVASGVEYISSNGSTLQVVCTDITLLETFI